MEVVLPCTILIVLIVNVNTCLTGTVMFGYQSWNCISVDNCRSRNFVIFGRTCMRTCPLGTYLLQANSFCYNHCPRHTVLNGTECLNGTYCMSQNNQVLFNGTCQATCPSSMLFRKYGTCYRTCPNDTVVNGSECLFQADCKKNGFVNGTACVDQCPPESKFIANGTCRPECPPRIPVTANGTLCLSVEECTVKGIVFNNTCVSGCPHDHPYNNQGTCYRECPIGKVALGNQCIPIGECAQRKMVMSGNLCIATCPDDLPLEVDNICLSNCHQHTVLYSNTCISEHHCVDSFSLYRVVYNGTCVDTCPLEARFNHQGTCGNTCPRGTVVSDLRCIDSRHCVNSGRYISNWTCVPECPQTAPFVSNGVCYDTCPNGYVISAPGQVRCITEVNCIDLKEHIHNNTCVTSCPRESPYINSSYCYQMCPNGTLSLPNKRCISPMICNNQGFFEHGSKCLNACPPTAPYTLDNTCMSTCPANSTLFPTKRCLTQLSCSSETDAVTYNGSCLPSCPHHVPYKHDGKCFSSCPPGMLRKEFDCVINCNGGVIYNGSCLPSCPHHFPYKHDRKCFSSCPPGMLRKEFDCVINCNGGVTYNGSCLPSCPQNAPYKHNRQCLSKCPTDLIRKGSECVNELLCSAGVVYKGVCLSVCPDDAPYMYKLLFAGTCHSVCPRNTVLNGSVCILELFCIANENVFIYNGSCVTECPPGSAMFVNQVCYNLVIDHCAIKVIPPLFLVVLALLVLLVYNPSKSRQMNEPQMPLLDADKELDIEEKQKDVFCVNIPAQEPDTTHKYHDQGPTAGVEDTLAMVEIHNVSENMFVQDRSYMDDSGMADTVSMASATTSTTTL
ncbi:proprotein convertase subtilisin/kexin type 5-like [Haliotis rufescens]|uniref:proprotein convertase subtilisin/kexin type 5-like n=1 Tax=Haliotis rufescens TaxID=6454 RepID=UPI00201F6CC3|nr:proprotein convertase subtilisin/kexin type 5-like [Haliotis rufescens]